MVGAGLIGDDRLREARGGSEVAGRAANERLVGRGLLTPDGELTDAGTDLRVDLERGTDELAHQPYVDGLTEPGLDLLLGLLAPPGNAVLGAGIIPFPNPV